MKRILLYLVPAIILAFVLISHVPVARADSQSDYAFMPGQFSTTVGCSITFQYVGTVYNSSYHSGGFDTINTSHDSDGQSGTMSWDIQVDPEHPWGYPALWTYDVFSATVIAGTVITVHTAGSSPYHEWQETNTHTPVFMACDNGIYGGVEIDEHTSVTNFGDFEGTTECHIGYWYGQEGRAPIDKPYSYSWNWWLETPCISIENCGGVQDAHMVLDPPASPWIPAGLNETHSGSEWQLVDASSIRQTIVLTDGIYDVLVIARSGSSHESSIMKIQIGQQVNQIMVTSSDKRQYDVIMQVTGGSQDLVLWTDAGSGVFVDYVCINPGVACQVPCGLGDYDRTISNQYLRNSEFYGLEYPPGLWSVNCSVGAGIPGSVGLACSAHKSDTGLNAYNWSGSGINSSVSGVKRWSGAGVCGQALGLMPPPLQNGTTQIMNMRPAGPYNIALRMKRVYGNSRLTICGQTIDDTPLGEWTDASFYCQDGRNDVTLLADCLGGSCVSHYEGSSVVDYAAVEVDDVYIIPGGQISCTVTMVPTMNCINNNYHLIGLSSRTEMQGNSPQTKDEEGWTLSNARMGSLAAGPYAHQARLWQSNGDTFISQYVPAQPGSIADGDYIVPGRSYSITVSASRYDNTDATLDVVVGAQSPGAQTWNIPLEGANASTIWSSGFVATDDMLNGNNMAVRVNNTGGSVLVDSVCISTGGPAITPTNACIGTWLSSSGGSPYSTTTLGGDYIKNVIDLSGNYRLDISGASNSSNQMTVKYHMSSTGEDIDLALVFIGSGEFNAVALFPTPPTGFSSGELRIYTQNDVTFTSVCLSLYDSPGGPGPSLPGPAAIPECGTATSRITTSFFYMMSPYSVTTEYTETAPAYYLAELTYNYAIYPLVCTTISIANWQYDAYNQFMVSFDKMVDEFRDYFQQIIAVLWAIYDKLGQGSNSGLDLLGLLWQLFMMLIKLLLKLLALIYQVLDLVIGTLRDISLRSKSELATSYPITCAGDARWLCVGLAAIIAADNMAGQWIRLVAYLAVGCLTIGLIFWLSGQVRKLLQPQDTSTSDG